MNKVRIAIVLVGLFAFPAALHAQFTRISHSIPALHSGSVAWGDYDNDGDIDALVTGLTGPDNGPGPTPFTGLYQNDGAGTFTFIVTSLVNVQSGSVAWGDYDKDGDLDILLTGVNVDYQLVSAIYRNDGGGSFTDIAAGLPGVHSSSVAWGDCDNDGDLDVLLTGSTGSTNIAGVFRNDDNGTFTDSGAGLIGVSAGSLAVGDYDNDGDLDVLLTGETGSGLVSRVYRNNGLGVFTDLGVGLTGVKEGQVGWGDYDNDGDLDILLTGASASTFIARVHRNDGGTFVDVYPMPYGVSKGAAVWGDYENDGDLDILVSGEISPGGAPLTRIWRQNGNGTGIFVDISTIFQPLGVKHSSAAWGDFDNDRDLDILIIGHTQSANTGVTDLFRNDGAVANAPPATPSSLNGEKVPGTNQLVLSWAASTDAQTPAAGLSYNLRVGLTPGGSEIMGPMASSSNGYRRVVQIGNAQKRTTWTLTVPPAPQYYFTVQAIDPTYGGSGFAPVRTVTPGYPPGWGAGGDGVLAGSFPANIRITDVQVLPDGWGGAFVLWRRTPYGQDNGDIFLQRLTGTGQIAAGWPNPGLAVCDDVFDQVQPSMCRDGANGVYVCWSDARLGNAQRDIYVQRVTASGAIAAGWPGNGKAVCTADFVQSHPRIGSNGDGAVVAWADRRNDNICIQWVELWAQRVSGTGQILWAHDGVKPPAGFLVREDEISIAADLSGDAVLAWSAIRPTCNGCNACTASYYPKVYMQRLRATDGAYLWGPVDESNCWCRENAIRPEIQVTAAGGYDLCFSQGTPGAEDLHYERLNAFGQSELSHVVSSAAGAQGPGTMLAEPTGGVVLGWWDTRNGPFQIYAHRAYLGGSALTPCWLPNGAEATPVTSFNFGRPAVASDLHGGLLAVYDYGNDLYVRHVFEDGTADPAFPGVGVPICLANDSQLDASVATVSPGRIIGAWIDYRGGTPNPAVYANEVPFTAQPEVQGVTNLTVQGTGWHSAGIQWTEPPSDPLYGAPAFFEVRVSGVAVDFIPAQGLPGSYYCYPFYGLSQCSVHTFEVRTIFACGHQSWVASVSGATQCDGPPYEPVPCEGGFRSSPHREEGDGSVMQFGWVIFGPNPASGKTWAVYGVPRDLGGQPLEIAWFDVAGRRVGLVEAGLASAGLHRIELDAQELQGVRRGLLFLRIRIGDLQLTKRVVFTD